MANSMTYTKEFAESNAALIKFITSTAVNVIVPKDLSLFRVPALNALKIMSMMNISKSARQMYAQESINSTVQ